MSSQVAVDPADGAKFAHANSQLSLSYDGSELDELQQDGAESKPEEATVNHSFQTAASVTRSTLLLGCKPLYW